MKRVMLLIVTIILLLPLISATPSYPFPQPCEDGSDVDCITEGGPFFSETYTVTYDEVGEYEIDCPVVYDYSVKGQETAYYGYIAVDGYMYADLNFPLRQHEPSEIRQRDDFACGRENILELRPESPPPKYRSHQEQWNYQRLKANTEKKIGVELNEEGKYEYTNPIVQEEVDSGLQVPPSLPESPKLDVIFTGYATSEPQKQVIDTLVVLVEFPDQTHKVSVEEIEEIFFGEDSLASYFDTQSYGTMEVRGTVVPTWYTLTNDMEYYGGDYEKNVEDMIVEAIYAADPDIDFSQFDNDNDGIVDSFFVVHAGEPDESGGGNGPEIWSHYYSITPVSVDGVQVIDYETVSEESPLGIIIHEFGHYLGLPDMYDTVFDDGSSKGVGDWSIMGYGGYLKEPGSFDPWSKEYLGWAYSDIFTEVTLTSYFTLVEDLNPFGLKYLKIPLSEDESFYLENRHEHKLMKGGDAGGILIWHVDESIMYETGTWNGCSGTRWDCNVVNGDATHKGIDVEEADGDEDLNTDKLGDDDDPWCLGCAGQEFYYGSVPSSQPYGTSDIDVAISVYSAPGDNIDIGIALDGVLLEASTTETPAEEVYEGSYTEESPPASSSLPSWVLFVLGIVVTIVVVGVVIVGIGFMRKGKGGISPQDYQKFKK